MASARVTGYLCADAGDAQAANDGGPAVAVSVVNEDLFADGFE